MECPICIEDIVLKPRDEICLDCGHLFHASCLLKWWGLIEMMTCPYCMSEENCENLVYDGFLNKLGWCNSKDGLPADTLLLKKTIIKTGEKYYLNGMYEYRDIYNIFKYCKSERVIGKILDKLVKRLENLAKRGYFRKDGEMYYYQ